ncbi:hypothetical protein [Mycolicibacterium tusciae]|uniref:hypothetical protein n=1 Tax=Mycolicibacterium tusciae TaxID=75922 RepID=UPI00024A4B82|nr:hypothetical protein [Mycolicibacterium tusciae]
MTTLSRVLLPVLLICGLVAVPVAHAQPADVVGPAEVIAPVTPISWAELGQSNELVVSGSDREYDVTIATPYRVRPTLLTGQIGSVRNAIAGRIDVYDSLNVYLGTIPAPIDQSTQPFTIDISVAHVVDDEMTLTFVLRNDNPPVDSCAPLSSAKLSQLATTFAGPSPFPMTLADFLPGYLDRILIRVGANPPKESQQAALSLVANLTNLYRPIPVDIAVDATDDPVPATYLDGLARVIVIKAGGPAGLSVINAGMPEATLLVTGNGVDLIRQVELFTDRRYELAQSPEAAVTAASENSVSSATVKTFAELGMSAESSVIGATTLYVGFDATQFGVGPIAKAKIQLRANYTPVSGGEGSILIRSGSTVVASHLLDDSGFVEINGDIAPEALSSTVGLGIELRYTPTQQCGPLNDSITFVLDASSTVSVTPGKPPTGGFRALPMAFSPEFDVALSDPTQLHYAARTVNLLGQQSSVVLRPSLTSLDDGIASSSGLLIVAPGDELSKRGLTATILAKGKDSATVNGRPSTDLKLNGSIGVIQAFTDKGRMVLALSGEGDWSRVDRSFDYINAQESGWRSLSGDVVATGAEYQTVNLTVREGNTFAEITPPSGWRWWTWTSGVATLVILLSAIVVTVVRRRRHR